MMGSWRLQDFTFSAPSARAAASFGVFFFSHNIIRNRWAPILRHSAGVRGAGSEVAYPDAQNEGIKLEESFRRQTARFRVKEKQLRRICQERCQNTNARDSESLDVKIRH